MEQLRSLSVGNSLEPWWDATWASYLCAALRRRGDSAAAREKMAEEVRLCADLGYHTAVSTALGFAGSFFAIAVNPVAPPGSSVPLTS